MNACFRHQHPEAFDRLAVEEGEVPPHLRYGTGEVYEVRPGLGEEPMGNPEHIPL